MKVTWWSRLGFLVVAAVLCSGRLVLTRSATPEYTVTDLGPFWPWAINAAGDVVGDDQSFGRAFFWSRGVLTELDLGGAGAFATDINDLGQIAGVLNGANGPTHFIYLNGTILDVGARPSFAYPAGINNAGDVTGQAGDVPFVYTGGSVHYLPMSQGCGSGWAWGINDSGLVAGDMDCSSGSLPVLWRNGILQVLPLAPGLTGGNAWKVNEAGQAVGDGGAPDRRRTSFYQPDALGNYTATDIGQLPGFDLMYPGGINNHGVIVGQAYSPGERAIIWDAVRGLRDLNDFIPADSGITLEYASDINDAGAIVGSWHLNGQQRGFLLTPIASADTVPPTVVCASPDSLWHATNVSLGCTASDDGSGLANAADSSFTLVTGVADGTENANAATESRSVCDVAGNCTTVGPIAGNKIDRRGPAIAIAAPTAGPFLLGQSVSSNYSCADGGSGIATCSGSVASGSSIDTSTPGTHTFSVTATDAAGNTTTSIVTYTVTYGVCALFDQTKASKAGSTIPIKLNLCNAAGANVSSASVPITATAVYLVSNNAPGPLEDSGNANPDYQFRFAGGSYIFNLSLKGFSQGTYALAFTAAGDPAAHAVQFQVK